jgi:hypothetical protein
MGVIRVVLTHVIFVFAHLSGLLLGLYSTSLVAARYSQWKTSRLLQLLIVNAITLFISFSTLSNDFDVAPHNGIYWSTVLFCLVSMLELLSTKHILTFLTDKKKNYRSGQRKLAML